MQLHPRSVSDIIDSARPIVAEWRGPNGLVRATDPASIVRFLRLREESGMKIEAWCKALHVPQSTGYFWTQGRGASGQEWPALAAALAKAAGADLASGMNAALAPPADPSRFPTAQDHAHAHAIATGDKIAALALLTNARVPSKPAPGEVSLGDIAAVTVEVKPPTPAAVAPVADPDVAPPFNLVVDPHDEAREIVVAKAARGHCRTPWSLGEAATLLRLHAASGQTMDAFAKAVGLQSSALSVWASGRTTSGKVWPELCEVLGVDPATVKPKAKPSPSEVLDRGTPITFDPTRVELTIGGLKIEGFGDGVKTARDLIGNAPAERLAALGIRATSVADDDTITLALTAGGPAQRALVRFALGITPGLRIEV